MLWNEKQKDLDRRRVKDKTTQLKRTVAADVELLNLTPDSKKKTIATELDKALVDAKKKSSEKVKTFDATWEPDEYLVIKFLAAPCRFLSSDYKVLQIFQMPAQIVVDLSDENFTEKCKL